MNDSRVVFCILYLIVTARRVSSCPAHTCGIETHLRRPPPACGTSPKGAGFPRASARRPGSWCGGGPGPARPQGAGFRGNSARLPAPPPRGGSPAPGRALAQAARARPPPSALAPSRPRARGGLAARAGRGNCASRAPENVPRGGGSGA